MTDQILRNEVTVRCDRCEKPDFRLSPGRRAYPTLCLRTALLFLFALLCSPVLAQQPRKLPSADKIVENYLKAIGGKKRVVAIRDATYEWTIQLQNQTQGVAKVQFKAPASLRSELSFGNGQIISAANSRSVWVRGLDGQLRTLTGPEAAAAKLQAALDVAHLVDYKKANILARVLSTKDSAAGPAYVVEFSTRSGGRLRYLFSTTTKLLVGMEDYVRRTTTSFEDYRPQGGILEPHVLRLNLSGTGELRFALERVSYNSGIASNVFDPPRGEEALDVAALLREVSRNQDEIEKRFNEYSFLQKETDREIDGKGVVKKETVKVSEVFPIANREPIVRLISENGVPLSAERAAKEEKRVQEEFQKAERDKDKDAQKQEQRRAERLQKQTAGGKQDGDDDVEISQFLKVCEFVSPRHERFQDRNAVVFDFRAKPGLKPANRQESLISKLVGVVWIDPVDKQVIRLEARLAEGFKMAGGLLLSLRPGAALVMEQQRMNEGIWLPRLAQINLSVKVLLFGGGDFNKTVEWSDYKHFSTAVNGYKLEAPKTGDTSNKKP
jgi:hypothetical protein